MKYKCTHITKNGLGDYVLRIEEKASFLDRFLFSKSPKIYSIQGNDDFWEYTLCTYKRALPQELKDFANSLVREEGYHLRIRK